MKKIGTQNAPAAVGPYSQAIEHNGFLYVSGQLPLDATTGEIVGENAAQQVRQCLANIKAIAEAAGVTLANTIKTTVLVTNLGEFAELNAVYSSFFGAPYPARVCYQVSALPKGAQVEVEAVIALV